MDTPTKVALASQFFSAGNAIAAFCALQTATFLVGFAKDSSIISALLRWRPYSSVGAVVVGLTYFIGIGLCGTAELILRWKWNGVFDGEGVTVCVIGIILRAGAVLVASLTYLYVFVAVCREENWLNKNPKRTRSQMPRLHYKPSALEDNTTEIINAIDKFLFPETLEGITYPRFFPYAARLGYKEHKTEKSKGLKDIPSCS